MMEIAAFIHVEGKTTIEVHGPRSGSNRAVINIGDVTLFMPAAKLEELAAKLREHIDARLGPNVIPLRKP